MGVDVVDIVGRQASIGESVLHGEDRGLAVRARAGAVEAVAALAAAGDDTEDRGATRQRVVVILQHQGTGALAHDETVAVLREGFRGAFRQVVLGGESREQREADQRLCMDRAVGADAQGCLRIAPSDRLDAHLDRGRAGGAGGRERDRRTLGAETVGDMVGDAAEDEELVHLRVLVGRGGAQQAVIVDRAVDRLGKLLLLRPFHLDGGHRHEELAREIAGRADAALADGLFGCERRELLGELGGRERAVEQEIDGAADAGLQALGREAIDAVDTRLAGRQRLPVGLLALAERGDDAEPGDGDERTALGVAMRGHGFNPHA